VAKKHQEKHRLGGPGSTCSSAEKQICEWAARTLLCTTVLMKDADPKWEMWVWAPAWGTTQLPGQKSLTLSKVQGAHTGSCTAETESASKPVQDTQMQLQHCM